MNTLIFEYSRPIPLWLGRKSPDQPYKVARRAEKREREREREREGIWRQSKEEEEKICYIGQRPLVRDVRSK